MQTQGESKPDSGSRQATEHVNKQEQPQTHEDREAQKLVERIQKKASTQRKNRSARTPPSLQTKKTNHAKMQS
jgi:hypothetical protein